MGTTQKQSRIRGTQTNQRKAQKVSSSHDAEQAFAKEKPIIGNPAEEKQDNPHELIMKIRQLQFINHAATSRKERAEQLMQRKVAKKWDAKKKAQMVRRLTTANGDIEQSTTFIDQLQTRLEQVMSAAQTTE